MPDVGAPIVAALALVGLVAGTIDAIAGGGGLITVPALLAVGLPPHLVLGTNKGQSVFGSGASLVRFAHGGLIDRSRARLTFPAGLFGALLGTALVLAVPPAALRVVVVVLLAAVALFVGLRRTPQRVMGSREAVSGGGALVRAVALALAIGAYDGFFGPGTGTFLIVGFVALLGDGLAKASAEAKVVNFASNLAALSLFAWRGLVLWKLAVPMAAGQLLGGWLGAHLAIRRGDRLVRRAVVFVALVAAAKLAHDGWSGP